MLPASGAAWVVEFTADPAACVDVRLDVRFRAGVDAGVTDAAP